MKGGKESIFELEKLQFLKKLNEDKVVKQAIILKMKTGTNIRFSNNFQKCSFLKWLSEKQSSLRFSGKLEDGKK